MKVHQEVYLKSKSLTADEIVDAFRRFAQQTTGWTFMDEQSEDYTRHVGSPSCMLLLDDSHFDPAVGLTEKTDSVYYVANIVPGKAGHIPMMEYNALAKRFAVDFRRFARSKKVPISVLLSNEDAGLKDIIPSPKVREFFERYLLAYPTSYHAKDIERLDVFVCAASRYCRKRVDLDRLQRYLIEDLNWSAKDAQWCRDRIETGLDILAVNRRF